VIVQSQPQVFCRSLVFTGEAEFLTFKLANGSACLTSHRLIIVEHQPDKLNKEKRKDYSLKNFEKAQIKDTPLTAQFKDKKVKIQPQHTPMKSTKTNPKQFEVQMPHVRRFSI